MKAALRLLFLLFYVASSYAITQERTALIVEKFQRSSSRDDGTQVKKGCKSLFDGFPKYRQAKPKASFDLYFHHTEAVHLLPHVSDRSFELQTISLKSLFSLASILFRAPPARV